MPSGKCLFKYSGAMGQIPQLFVYKYFMGQIPVDIKIVGQIPFSHYGVRFQRLTHTQLQSIHAFWVGSGGIQIKSGALVIESEINIRYQRSYLYDAAPATFFES